MDKSETRIKYEKEIMEKIQSIFDNAEHIQQFHFEIDGGVGMNTIIEYTVAETLQQFDD